MTKPEIIFLPGLMCDERLFEAQISALARVGYKCSVGDITRAATISGIATEILKHAPQKFALAGLSMGGIVAFEILRQAPDRVTHLALLNTNADADTKQTTRKAQLCRVADGELIDVMREELKPEYLAEPNRSKELLGVIEDMGIQLGKDVFARQSIALMGRQSARELLPDIKCPTLVLTGRDDKLCTPEMHQSIAGSIENSTLVILSDCGHLSTMERPKAVTASIQELLETTPRTEKKKNNGCGHLRLVASNG